MMNQDTNQNNVLIYQSNGDTRIDVRFEGETVWLTQAQLAELFQTSRPNITMHIKNVFDDGELLENSVCKDFLHTASDGKSYKTKGYNLDLIISLGYRVKSSIATQFRIWATQRLREYLIKGFTLDDERMKNAGGGSYWKELLDRIRDIRSSEKVLYRQVLDLYATSIDYDPKSSESKRFFQTVQNKLHYATNQQTAAETIFQRVDASKEFMGLTTFKGEYPVKADSETAKNFLTEEELFRLNRLVSAFFDLAEIRAQERHAMKMQDWITELDKFCEIYGKGSLKNAGKVSHKQAVNKASEEYRKYQEQLITPVEKEYLDVLREVQKKVENKGRSTKE